MSHSMAESKPMPVEVNAAAFGSVLVSDLMLWLVMPMSPRRYQPPKSAGGGGAYIGGAAIGRSAANAAVDRVTAPAAIRNLTLRIGFVLLAGEATRKPHIEKSTCGRCPQKLKHH